MKLMAYSDSDFANHEDRRSIAGYITMYGNSVISWCSKVEQTVALHTTEAEYIALSMLVQEVIHLRSMGSELKINNEDATIIYVDNMSALKLSKNSEFHPRTKHVDVVHHFLRERQKQNEIVAKKVSPEDNIADVFTKPLGRQLFERQRNQLRVFAIDHGFTSGGALGS